MDWKNILMIVFALGSLLGGGFIILVKNTIREVKEARDAYKKAWADHKVTVEEREAYMKELEEAIVAIDKVVVKFTSWFLKIFGKARK